jgi:hypothetical protein
MKFTPWWVTWLAVLALLFGPLRGIDLLLPLVIGAIVADC